MGRTDLALKQDYLKIIVRISLLMVSFKYGIIFIATAELLSTIIHFFINCYSPGKILQYGAFKQIRDLTPMLFFSLIMAITMYLVMIPFHTNISQIIFGGITGFLIYVGLLYFFNIKEFSFLLNKARLLFKK